MADLRATNRRELQLDAIASILIVAMAVVVGLLVYFLSASGVKIPETLPLASWVPRVLLAAFVVLVVIYLADQRYRLRLQVEQAVAEVEIARAELDKTVRWLRFSHQAASVLGVEGVEGGLKTVLSEAVDLYNADAAAVLGEDEEYSYVAPDAPADEAERALSHVALVAAGHAAPLHVQSLDAEQGHAIAVPLRVAGELRFVLCIWRREEPFDTDQLDALGLMGSMVELAIEREESLKEAQSQLEGTLRVLQYLVADKRPDYSRHAVAVAELASAIGRKLGLHPSARRDLRLAGLVHDVGLMSLPRKIGDASRPLSAEDMLLMRQHPRIGSEIAKAANFDEAVQVAVMGHHERMDGSGYPDGLRGNDISVEARVLAVCEVFDSMTHRAYHGADTTIDDAIAELTDNAGKLYDRAVVNTLLAIVNGDDGDTDLLPDLELESVGVGPAAQSGDDQPGL